MAQAIIVTPTFLPNNNTIFSTPLNFFENGLGAPYIGSIRVEPFGPQYKLMFGGNSPFESIEELFAGRVGTTFATDLHRRYVRRFRVIVRTQQQASKDATLQGKGKMIGPAFVSLCPALPVPFAPYIPYRKEEWDAQAKAVEMTAAQEHDDDMQCWVVTVQYSTEMPLWGPLYGKHRFGWDMVVGVQNQPWKIPPWKEWETEQFTKYPMVDLKGRPYVNSADQPLLPAPGVTDGHKVVIVNRYEKDFEARQEDYVFVSNSIDFLGSPQGYALCVGPTRATEKYIGDIKFHHVVYRVILRKKVRLANGTFSEPFEPARYLNAGMYEKDSVLGVPLNNRPLIPIVEFGHPVTNPVLLDLDGRKQTARDANGVLIPTFIERNERRLVDLNVLLNPQ